MTVVHPLVIDDGTALAWQREFPGLVDSVHLANCSHGPQSRRVRGALEAYLDGWRAAGMDWDAWMAEIERAKASFARLIGADPEEVAISTSASSAVASIASAIDWQGARRKIVTTEAEFPTVGHVWLAHRKYGAVVEFVPLRGETLLLEDYESRIDERTALVSATHVYYRSGFKQDLGRISKLAHEAGSLFLVDAYQSLGTCPVDVLALGVDILVSGTLKYLLGLPGIAFIYVRRGLVDSLRPAFTGWFGRVDPFAFDVRALDYAAGARRLETGTPPVYAAIAASAGMEIIEQAGTIQIERRIADLSDFTVKTAQRLDLEYVGPIDLREKGATTAIRVPNPREVERRLKERRIVVSARGDVIRIAPHFFTTRGEIELALRELRALAIA